MAGLGIDFGTTNSAVVLYDGERFTQVVGVMPSALYLDREFQADIGQPAIDRYLRENTDRVVELTAEEVGEVVFTVAGGDEFQGSKQDGGAITTSVQVHAWTDAELPGRLFRSVKRWLGSGSIDRVRVFERSYRIVALVTPILAHLRETVLSAGAQPDALYLGRPVRYEGRGADANRVAVARVLEACEHAGFPDPTLYPEPVAAALSFVAGRPEASERVLLAFDFGGGTLDLTAVRARGKDMTILATHGIGIGGDAIDRAVYRAAVFPELGSGSMFHRPIGPELKEVPFPFREIGEKLINWTLAYELNQGDMRALIKQATRESGETGRKFDRLYELVTKNHAYRVFRAIEAAKIRLSEDEQTIIDIPELDLEAPIQRRSFEAMIAPLLDDVDACVEQVLERAGLDARDVDLVVRTGGSSRIPEVIRRLEERFPGRVVEHDPFTSIAAGLAVASYHGYAPAL